MKLAGQKSLPGLYRPCLRPKSGQTHSTFHWQGPKKDCLRGACPVRLLPVSASCANSALALAPSGRPTGAPCPPQLPPLPDGIPTCRIASPGRHCGSPHDRLAVADRTPAAAVPGRGRRLPPPSHRTSASADASSWPPPDRVAHGRRLPGELPAVGYQPLVTPPPSTPRLPPAAAGGGMEPLELPPGVLPVGGPKAATAAAVASPTAVNGCGAFPPPARVSFAASDTGSLRSRSSARRLIRLRSSSAGRPAAAAAAVDGGEAAPPPADAERSVGCFGRLASAAAPAASAAASAAAPADDPRLAAAYARSNAALLAIFSDEYVETRQWSSWGPDAAHLPAFTLWAAWYGTGRGGVCSGGRCVGKAVWGGRLLLWEGCVGTGVGLGAVASVLRGGTALRRRWSTGVGTGEVLRMRLPSWRRDGAVGCILMFLYPLLVTLGIAWHHAVRPCPAAQAFTGKVRCFPACTSGVSRK